MVDDVGSTVVRRQLGRHLRELRELARLSQDEAAIALDCSRQKIWRIESGTVPVRGRDVKVLGNLYGAEPETIRELAALALQTAAKGWWHAYGDALPAWFARYVGLEIAASRLRHYSGELVPELLQTPSYAAALRDGRPRLAEPARDRLAAVTSRRQRLLTRRSPPPPRLDVVLSEAVLRRRVVDGPEMAEQLCHLDRVAGIPHVSLRVLPLDAGPALASQAGTFTMLDFSAGDRPAIEPTTVYHESLTGALYLVRPAEVAAYEEAWSGLDKLALNAEESRAMVGAVLARCCRSRS